MRFVIVLSTSFFLMFNNININNTSDISMFKDEDSSSSSNEENSDNNE